MADYLDDIIGQPIAKRFVRTAIKRGNLYNLLFVGPKGVGKRQFAFALARTLDCPANSPNCIVIAPIPSKIKDKKDKIYAYTRQYLPDQPTIEVEDRTSILIEQIRDLIERLVHMPAAGSKRMVLILEADRMTDAAANCFLKTLEEPPLDTVFVLTTSRPNFVLPTIQSRCQKILFTYLNSDQIKGIVFDANDDFLIGSPGEIMRLRDNSSMENVLKIFQKAPLSTQVVAEHALQYRNKTVIDLLYQLMLLYRVTLYRKLNLPITTSFESEITRKANRTSLEKILQILLTLNCNINNLEQNPNRLLLLLDILTKLP